MLLQARQDLPARRTQEGIGQLGKALLLEGRPRLPQRGVGRGVGGIPQALAIPAL
jgi:hypothetical protein